MPGFRKPTINVAARAIQDGSSELDVVTAIAFKLARDAVSGLAAITNANAASGFTGLVALTPYATSSNVADATRATAATANTALVVLKNAVDEVKARVTAIATALGVSVSYIAPGATNGALENVFGTAIATGSTLVVDGTEYQTLVTNINATLAHLVKQVNKVLSALGATGLRSNFSRTQAEVAFTQTLTATSNPGPAATRVTTDLTLATGNLTNMVTALNAAIAAAPIGTFLAFR